MENLDNNTEEQKAHPKPSDDAQSQIETIIPSTESEASTTTKVKEQHSEEPKSTEKEEDADLEQNEEPKQDSETEQNEESKPNSDTTENNDEEDKSDDIETVSV
ncbi:hypothetical protein ACFOWA_15950 [Pedobacter lithocola]|uniref:Uncharacterized protein n=1 Tax=Pedobacter lithocola TaxID=1908239 RepID=A0ABV8PF47_9SPHI